MNPFRRQAVEICSHFGAVKVVHSKSSDKHHDFESGSEQKLAQTDLRYIGG